MAKGRRQEAQMLHAASKQSWGSWRWSHSEAVALSVATQLIGKLGPVSRLTESIKQHLVIHRPAGLCQDPARVTFFKARDQKSDVIQPSGKLN
jgi:hypothetical protein